MRFLSGFESTHIFGTGKDVLDLTNHTLFVEDDLRLAKLCGIELLRYSAPWHNIERVRGVYDWKWLDRALNCQRELGISPILDPLHHTSFPEWLEGGFANPRFVEFYVRFIKKLAERYPWVKYYTIINEPFVTALFCGHEGIWYPYYKSPEHFVRMILNVGKAICFSTDLLSDRLPEVHFIHVDTCEKHRALNDESIEEANWRNELRFLVSDLILGKINEIHPLYSYLRKHGASDKELVWFVKNPSRIDILGLDYYQHSELEWNQGERIYPNRQPEGFAAIAMDYVNRYNLSVMLSETNIRGEISDRLSWLKFMVEQCEILKTQLPSNIPFEGFCWYPLIDSTDWCSLVREANGYVDPQGIFYLDKDCQSRNHSELSEIYALLANGEYTSKDIPAYPFSAPINHQLQNFLPLMSHWNWQEI